MPTWNAVLEDELSSNIDKVRRKYLDKLFKKTGRNLIAYYSGWMQHGQRQNIDINDLDMNGFMSAVHGMDCSLGLDLVLHTPGGAISATEQIVFYLKQKFSNKIRAFIPQAAMSAGTMLACACSEIYMGKQSCLGPIDPHLNGIPARGVVEEFEKAIQDVKDRPESIPIWQTIIGKYHPTFIDSCNKAWERSRQMVTSWLAQNMCASLGDNAEQEANAIVEKLTASGHTLGHDKHISFDEAQAMGLKIRLLEDDQELQDLVLTVHHCYMLTFSQAPVIKAVENQKGIGVFNMLPANQ